MTAETIQAVGGILVPTMTLLTKLVIGQHLGKKRDKEILTRLELLEQKSDRNHKLATEFSLRLLHTEKKLASAVTGETLVPEKTSETERMQERAKDIVTGRHPKPPKPKGGS